MRDIIDLEFLLSLDETDRDGAEDDISSRDRDIFHQINAPDLDDAGLIREWLSYRKLLFFHQSSAEAILPGTLFSSLMGWAARGLFLGGLVLGMAAAYSFLAYHGSQPVNVTVFISVFILLQALLSFVSLAVLARQAAVPHQGRQRSGFFQTLVAGVFFRKLCRLCDRAWKVPEGKALKSLQDTGALLGKVHRSHNRVMFWPFFILTSLVALGFCCGALGATLFRVAVTDLAFGWQSTLLTSGDQVHDLVRWMALPWSWVLPHAMPDPAQIEGSRMILKEGIAGLATEHLTAWWPFLSMGILVYGIMLRLVVVGLASWAQSFALAGIDVGQPRFRRLLVRMRSPNMETRTRDWPSARSGERPPLPRPDPGTPASEHDTTQSQIPSGRRAGNRSTDATDCPRPLVLASEQAFPEMVLDIMVSLVEDQLGVAVSKTAFIGFEFEHDRELLQTVADSHGSEPVIILQEVWQPPIRGLLHYYSQLKSEVFPRSSLWIIVTRTPGEGDPGVPADDVNYQVWKKAVSQLNHPDIYLERMLP